jgi:N-acetylglucosamine kinase-like BadF-type ATPase
MTPPFYLGIDGGNSKTDVILGTADGHILAFVRGPGSSPHNLGLRGAIELLDELIATARAQAALSPADTVEVAAVYLAGADLPIEVAELLTAVVARGWARRTLVDNDCFALLRAGTAMPDAVAVVCGAGSNCVGVAGDGRTVRFPALGPISGDWGGGHELAEQALRYAARGEDGRGTPTALSAAIAARFGRPTVEAVSIALHRGDLPMDAIHQLTPLLFELAGAGDAIAGRIVARQVAEILAQYRVAAGRLAIRARPHALVLGGGVLRARNPLLNDAVIAGARAWSPRVRISVLEESPVIGAALLALDALGRAHAAESRLRAALRRARPVDLCDPAATRAAAA